MDRPFRVDDLDAEGCCNDWLRRQPEEAFPTLGEGT